MPNYCSNTATFSHPDAEQLSRVVTAATNRNLFREFAPIADDDNATEMWGTKWDAFSVEIEDANDDLVKLSFDTAWAPPIEFYNKMLELGFEITAQYHEPGMQFCGYYQNGDDVYYEYDSTNYTELPEKVLADFDIEDCFADYEIEDAA